ncbi:MAG TPA: tetratricopeptide repeat protein [Candidatus Angelobacter sp.]|nr:tetratricopeptide repeat protein [Candidatus Angelobacter sp.]
MIFAESRKLALSACVALLLSSAGAALSKPQNIGLEITTKSPEARAFFVSGLEKWQTLYSEQGLENWRKAVKADPNFALAHIFLADFSNDPAEQVRERERALATKQFAGPEEQLIIDWISDASEAHWIPAIQAMNEALEQYGNHKQLFWMAGMWLTGQQQWGRAGKFYEHAIHLDPNFADAWNSVAYCYARTRQFDKAFAAMKRYTELLPNESNPQDSFAEISRMAGRFDDALEHYHASLKIDPSFIMSQIGVGDTYALMGDETRARKEYEVAMPKAPNKILSAQWSLQMAITWVREGDYAGADKAFRALAAEAHRDELGNIEAEAYRSMALYQKNHKAAMQLLKQAESVVQKTSNVPTLLLQQELASILRTRIERAVDDNDLSVANKDLKRLAELSSSSSDGQIEMFYEGAAGTMAFARGHYQDAVAHLKGEDRNPYSLQRLYQAYEKLGDKEHAARVAEELAGFNEPVIDQAMVVPQFRKAHLPAVQETRAASGNE